MYIKKMLDKIIEKDNKYEMKQLGEIFVDMVDMKRNKNPMEYKDIVFKMHMMAYGEHLTSEEAKCWTDWMENKDGTKGAHWSYEQTENVRQQYAPELHHCDFFAILNMMYSDYYNPKFDTIEYITLAKDFMEDKDGGSAKPLKYYLFIVKE